MTPRLLILLTLASGVCAGAGHSEPATTPESPPPAETSAAVPATPESHGTVTEATPVADPKVAAPAGEDAVASPAEEAAKHGEVFGMHPPASPQPATQEEIASLLRIGQVKVEQADYVSAELAFRQVLAEKGTPEQDRVALMGLARTYRKKADFTKAAAVYEALIKQYPGDDQLPVVYLELGRTLRALGAFKPAIARFYSVINSTLKLPEINPDSYRQLARTAQFEIAETYFQAGDYDQANRFFSRLKLLDLAPEDRARAHFKSVYALTLAGEHEKAVSGLQSFIAQNVGDENEPEARYLLAVSLRQLGRSTDSLNAALGLLRAEKKHLESDPKRWAYWQRKTGNQLANHFYEQGDFGSAMLIYQNLAALSQDPTWRLPALYQVALCQERLYMADRARESYQSIIDNLDASATDGTRRPDLADLADMAAWRLKQLDWEKQTERQLTLIFPSERDRPVALHRPATPANDHDSGSAEKPSGTVR